LILKNSAGCNPFHTLVLWQNQDLNNFLLAFKKQKGNEAEQKTGDDTKKISW
jgi:hypothetical protein